jgi:GNAT superfamily N-acetyltransferase
VSGRPGVRSRAMTDADVPAVVELLDEALGPAPGDVDRRSLFEWKHLQNPFGRSIALVAELDGRVVGLRCLMRWRLAGVDGARALTAVRAVDTVTSPSVRRLGIFSRLTVEALAACEAEGVALVFNTPNDRSRPGYLKMGWEVVTVWPMWLRVRRPDRLATAALRRDLRSGAGVEPPAATALVPASEVLGGDRAPRGVEPQTLHTTRSLEYLRWRYAQGPIAYHVLADGGATVVTRLRQRGRLREAVVCEAFAPQAEGDRLRDLLRALPREAAADHAVAHLGEGWPARAALQPAGYHRLPRGCMTFTVRPVTPSSPDPLDPTSWSLSLGDLEVF